MKKTMFTHNVDRILSGDKTQTRRIIKGVPDWASWFEYDPINHVWMCYDDGNTKYTTIPRATFNIGERRYIAEKWRTLKLIDHFKPSDMAKGVDPIQFDDFSFNRFGVEYDPVHESDEMGRWRSPLHMCEWMSRGVIEVTGLRAERLQDISVEDCIAEGLSTKFREHDACCDLREQYAKLFDEINGPGSWASNPWVWVVEFEVVK